MISKDDIEKVVITYLKGGKIVRKIVDNTIIGINNQQFGEIYFTDNMLAMPESDKLECIYIGKDKKAVLRIKGDNVTIYAGKNGIELIKINRGSTYFKRTAQILYEGNFDPYNMYFENKLKELGITEDDFDNIMIKVQWKEITLAESDGNNIEEIALKQSKRNNIKIARINILGTITGAVLSAMESNIKFDIDKSYFGYKSKTGYISDNEKFKITLFVNGNNINIFGTESGEIVRVSFKCNYDSTSISVKHKDGLEQLAIEMCSVMKMFEQKELDLGANIVEMKSIIRKGESFYNVNIKKSDFYKY